ncbi:MAG: type III-B CRISPR module RAMP protein Cmr6 [Anaerolineae bacterium]
MKYLTPNDTAALLPAHVNKCHNLALILGRYVPQEVIEKGVKFRNKWMPEVVGRFNQAAVGAMVGAYHDRWQKMAESASATTWRMPLLTRLIVGLGGKGALEIGITLDKVTGLPYIPGSALKGLCRSYALYEIAAKHGVKPQEEKALEKLDEALVTGEGCNGDARVYADIFGKQEDAGKLIFFDGVVQALPNGRSLFALDAMTPHFSSYYRDNGRSAPADNDSPNPVTFITVAHGTTFSFAVGIRHGQRDQYTEGLRDTAIQWLKQALQDFGVGSKTAAGYGAFKGS